MCNQQLDPGIAEQTAVLSVKAVSAVCDLHGHGCGHVGGCWQLSIQEWQHHGVLETTPRCSETIFMLVAS